MWYEKYVKKEAKKISKAITNPVVSTKVDTTQDHKTPFFKVPTFQGDTLQGGDYINSVDKSFRSAAMARYLEYKSYCNNNFCLLGVFASRIREPIDGNNILSLLVTKLEHKNNCCNVWLCLMKYLTTNNITIACVMSQWKTLFSLKYESRYHLLTFYSKAKGISYQL